MGFTLTKKASADLNFTMHRLDEDGELFDIEPERDEYQVPEPDLYTLNLVGYSDAFELDDIYNPGKKKEMIRIELETTGHRRSKRNGLVFTVLVKPSLHEKATLGKIITAIMGVKEIPEGEQVEMVDMLGKSFRASVSVSDKGNALLNNGSILPPEKPFDDDEEEEEEADNPFLRTTRR